MATPTYTAIASITLSSSASSVEFSSIPQDYRDLVLVVNGTSVSGNPDVSYRANGNTGSNYSSVVMFGSGSSAVSFSVTETSGRIGRMTSATKSSFITSFQDYSATDKHKTILSRSNLATADVRAVAGRFASTSAITSLVVQCFLTGDNFGTGSTFALYGIAS